MKNFKLVVAALLVFAMFSCKTEDLGKAPVEKVSMTVTVNAPVLSSRAEVDPVVRDVATLTDVAVFVTNDIGTIITAVEFTQTDIDNDGKTFETTSDAKGTYVLANISGGSWFDLSDLTTDYVGQNIAALMAEVLDMEDLAAATVGVGEATIVPFFNEDSAAAVVEEMDGTEPEYPGTPDPDVTYLKSTIKIRPIVARIELGQIDGSQATSLPAGILPIRSFTLESIKMTNVYPEMALAGPEGTKLAKSGADNGATSDHFADIYTDEFEATNIYAPSRTGTDPEPNPFPQVWAYNIAPVKGGNATTGVFADVPRMLVTLTDIVLEDGDAGTSVTEPRYLIVEKYKLSDDSYITAFEAGKVYKITSLNFTYDKTSSTTEITKAMLTATVEVLGWEEVAITPEL